MGPNKSRSSARDPSITHSLLAKTSFDEILDLTADVSFSKQFYKYKYHTNCDFPVVVVPGTVSNGPYDNTPPSTDFEAVFFSTIGEGRVQTPSGGCVIIGGRSRRYISPNHLLAYARPAPPWVWRNSARKFVPVGVFYQGIDYSVR